MWTWGHASPSSVSHTQCAACALPCVAPMVVGNHTGTCFPQTDPAAALPPLGAPYCVLGPNGAGKTTLMNLLSGDIDPVSGESRRSHKLRIGRYAQVGPCDSRSTVPAHLGPCWRRAPSLYLASCQPRQNTSVAVMSLDHQNILILSSASAQHFVGGAVRGASTTSVSVCVH